MTMAEFVGIREGRWIPDPGAVRHRGDGVRGGSAAGRMRGWWGPVAHGVSRRRPGGAPSVSGGRIVTTVQARFGQPVVPGGRAPSGRPGKRSTGSQASPWHLFPRARFAGETPGHTRGRRSGRRLHVCHGLRQIGTTMTQKHRHSTLRSTSGGCLRVTHREDCGRVPSKRRCPGVCTTLITGWHPLPTGGRKPHHGRAGAENTSSRTSFRTAGLGARCRTGAGRVPRDRCAGGIAEGMGYVGLARHTTGLAAGPWPAARSPRPASHVLRVMGPPPLRTDGD